MSRSSSKLSDNLSEWLYNYKCTDCKSCLEYTSGKDNQLILKCLQYNKNHKKEFNEDLIKRFANTYQSCDKGINKLILLLRKGVYPYEYLDSWERFDETLLTNKEYFHSSLNNYIILHNAQMHLKQPALLHKSGFTYSACGPLTENKERIQKLKETGDTNYIYRNELDKACFQHDMAYRDFKDLPRRTA